MSISEPQMAAEPEDPQVLFADIRVLSPVSIIVPTYQEVENIPHLIARVDAMRRDNNMTLELLFMDDDSQDGSVEAVEASGHDWVRMIVRTSDRGLSRAVVDGFRAARYPALVCMDCDLSHPPEIIPRMMLALSSGQQFVVGSRYVPGGSTDDDWGFLRYLNSQIATLLARPLTNVRDPMSGYFAMRKSDFAQAKSLNPVGYKIGLELITKCGFENVAEVPIHFTDRVHGESKLTFKEQLKYIQHLRRLYIHKFENSMSLLQFLAVGASGVVVNLFVLTLLLALGTPGWFALAGGIGVSLCTNFLLNRRLTFSYARFGPILRQFAGFLAASSLGLTINYAVSLWTLSRASDDMAYAPQLAALTGIACGMAFNYIGNRFFVFRKKHFKK
ncbi:MAG: glycosyltransferase family 2 protein [Pseudomonadota bacterium]